MIFQKNAKNQQWNRDAQLTYVDLEITPKNGQKEPKTSVFGSFLTESVISVNVDWLPLTVFDVFRQGSSSANWHARACSFPFTMPLLRGLHFSLQGQPQKKNRLRGSFLWRARTKKIFCPIFCTDSNFLIYKLYFANVFPFET